MSICVRELDELKPDIQQYFDSPLFVCSEQKKNETTEVRLSNKL